MISRRKLQVVLDRLQQFPAVALLGPRQAGKTTLAEYIAQQAVGGQQTVYLDLEAASDRQKLSDAEYLGAHEEKLVILDEVQRMPDLFQSLRGLIDRGRRRHIRARSVSAAAASITSSRRDPCWPYRVC